MFRTESDALEVQASEFIGTLAVVFIWAIVIVVALSQLGVNIAPVLAGAGIVGSDRISLHPELCFRHVDPERR